LRSVGATSVLEQARRDRLVSLLIARNSFHEGYLLPSTVGGERHGLANKEGIGHVTITAIDRGTDEGRHRVASAVPERIRGVLDDTAATDSIGLGNVDARLRQVYGDDSGLVVETAPGAGTKVSFRVPKFAPGVHDAP
jgi:two-component system LytT family sensor kinase